MHMMNDKIIKPTRNICLFVNESTLQGDFFFLHVREKEREDNSN
jgi:hypothetical protein